MKYNYYVWNIHFVEYVVYVIHSENTYQVLQARQRTNTLSWSFGEPQKKNCYYNYKGIRLTL